MNKKYFFQFIPQHKSLFSGYFTCPFIALNKEESDLNTDSFEQLSSFFKNHFQFNQSQIDRLSDQQPYPQYRYSFFIAQEQYQFTFIKIDLSDQSDIALQLEKTASSQFLSREEFDQLFVQNEIITLPAFSQFLSQTENEQHYEMPDRFCNQRFFHGMEFYFIPSQTLPPLHYTVSLIIGDEDEKKILIDPSPDSEDNLRDYLAVLKQKKIDALLLSHHHPDHIQYSNIIAKELDVSILLSEKTAVNILKKQVDFFDHNHLVYLNENDVVTKSQSKKIQVIEFPGHASGLIGLIAEDKKWCFTADMIRNNGSVLIPYPDGNMREYFNSLEKLKKLNPQILITSHDLPVHSNLIIDKAIKYRLKKEKEIKNLFDQGFDEQAILDRLYQHVPEKFKKFALMMIQSHLKKIIDEQRAS